MKSKWHVSRRKNMWINSQHKMVCDDCPAVANWFYPDLNRSKYCDRCVPRGCSCQEDPDTGEPGLDKKGRELPCVDYSYFRKGLWLIDRPRPSERKLSPSARLRCWDRWGTLVDRREWRGWLRSWIKNPDPGRRPYRKLGWRNDPVSTRLLRQAQPLLAEIEAREANHSIQS